MEESIMIKMIFVIFLISTIVLIGNRIVDLIYRDKDDDE